MGSKKVTSMPASAKVIINTQRIRKDGTAAIYLRVIIDREIKLIPLDLYWSPKYFKEGLCRSMGKGPSAADDHNLIISDAMAKATEIFVQYRLRRLSISMDAFIKDFKTGLAKDDFLVYYESKMMQRLKEKEIGYSSKQSHQVTLNHLKNWKKHLSFSELDDRTAYKFEKWLIRNTGAQSINSRWGQHRNFKTYLNLAKREKIEFINPYDYFTAKSCMGRFQPLSQSAFMEIWEGYHNGTYNGSERASVRAFLFCCLTGMRHSDIRRVTLDWIDGEFFDFVPFKTRKHGTRVRIPASAELLDLIADEMSEIGKEPMFCSVAEQTQNKQLRQIGKLMGMKGNLCFQIGRETFATLYMEHDGKLEVLATFLGHTSTKMSEKYIKIRDSRKKQEMQRISNFLQKKEG